MRTKYQFLFFSISSSNERVLTEIENMRDGIGVRDSVSQQLNGLLLAVHQVDTIYQEKLWLPGVNTRPKHLVFLNGSVDKCCDPSEGSRRNAIC